MAPSLRRGKLLAACAGVFSLSRAGSPPVTDARERVWRISVGPSLLCSLLGATPSKNTDAVVVKKTAPRFCLRARRSVAARSLVSRPWLRGVWSLDPGREESGLSTLAARSLSPVCLPVAASPTYRPTGRLARLSGVHSYQYSWVPTEFSAGVSALSRWMKIPGTYNLSRIISQVSSMGRCHD